MRATCHPQSGRSWWRTWRRGPSVVFHKKYWEAECTCIFHGDVAHIRQSRTAQSLLSTQTLTSMWRPSLYRPSESSLELSMHVSSRHFGLSILFNPGLSPHLYDNIWQCCLARLCQPPKHTAGEIAAKSFGSDLLSVSQMKFVLRLCMLLLLICRLHTSLYNFEAGQLLAKSFVISQTWKTNPLFLWKLESLATYSEHFRTCDIQLRGKLWISMEKWERLLKERER